MTRTYKPYSLAEMVANTKLSSRLIERIVHLVSVGAISIQARNDGETFAAYSGNVCLTYNAVLFVKLLPGCSGGLAVAIERKNRPDDYLAKVADICTKYSYLLKSIK